MDDECTEELGRPISQMKVTELRDELAKRALSKSGNKKELIDRLRVDIHRQSSQKSSDAINLEQQQSLGGVDHQQLVGAGQIDVGQQQQIAHQLNLMYPPQQTSQMPTSIPSQYQQLPQQVQQQLIAEIQNNYQASIDNLQQQAQQQLANDDEPQNLKKTPSPPPIDMRVSQTAAEPDIKQVEPVSLDLSAHTPVEQGDEPSETDKDTTMDVGQAQPASENTVPAPDDSAPVSKEFEEPQTPCQAPISLKRGISDPERANSSREKRRKWSSKQESGQAGSDVQVMSGGISSQKLQELIDVSPPESKPAKQALTSDEVSQTLDSKNETEDLEEGQIMDTSGDSTKITDSEKVDSVESKTPPKIESEAKKEQEPQQEQLPERDPSNVLLVQNLVRPFTINSLKEVLSQHGPIVEDKFWTDKVKSKCCVVYGSIEVAKQTKESLNGQHWPLSNPKTLAVTFSSEEELVEYQKSDIAKPVENAPAPDSAENGAVDQAASSRSLVDRLGEKVNERERVSEQIKKRLGEKVNTDIEAKTSSVNRDGDGSQSQELDDLFRKTKSVPHLFWLPLTEDQAETKAIQRTERENRAREVEKSRRTPPRYRSQARPPLRNRSPPARRSPPPRRRSPLRYGTSPRRRSPPRYRSPVRQRSPIGRSPPPRHRSPLRRRSPVLIHRSPTGPVRRSPIRRSPGLTRRSPIRRSPGLSRRSPIRRSPVLSRRSPIRRSPGPMQRSPIRRSPGLIRRSPARRSPGLTRRSPIRRSPGPIRRTTGTIRQSPGPIRRSPGPIRRSPGQNRRIYNLHD